MRWMIALVLTVLACSQSGSSREIPSTDARPSVTIINESGDFVAVRAVTPNSSWALETVPGISTTSKKLVMRVEPGSQIAFSLRQLGGNATYMTEAVLMPAPADGVVVVHIFRPLNFSYVTIGR